MAPGDQALDKLQDEPSSTSAATRATSTRTMMTLHSNLKPSFSWMRRCLGRIFDRPREALQEGHLE